MLAHALAYAARGWPVLPVCWPDGAGLCACPKLHTDPKEIGKAPLTDRGVKDATTNPAQIERWWVQWPDANVAVDLAGAGLFLVDGDSGAAIKEAHRRSGSAGLPPAPIARSGRGDGWHHYYQRPADCPLYSTVRRGDSAALDLKTSGYGILPPSLHRSGRRYAWESPPDVVTLGAQPSWAVDVLHEGWARRGAGKVHFTADEASASAGAVLWARVRSSLDGSMIRTIEDGPGAYVAPDGRDSSRSGADYAVCRALIGLGLTDDDIRNVYQALPIGRAGKYAERGDDYLALTLGNARTDAEAPTFEVPEDAPAGAGSPDPDAGAPPQGADSSEPASSGARRRQSQGTCLVALAASADFFHTPEGEPWATVPAGSHREHWPLKTKGFRRWLARRFYESTGQAPGAQALQDALTTLEGRALFEAGACPVYTRVAEWEDTIYYDLADAGWGAVCVTPTGWDYTPHPPVKFRRPRGMLPLPRPVLGGQVDALRPFVNVADPADWRLLVAWLLGALRPSGPYPVLILHGEQGSAKSTTARVLRELCDPNSAPLRSEPSNERDLMIAATNGWMVTLDNLSRLPAWLSDALCRLACGGGFGTRELYSDADEIIFDAARPVLLTGIDELATRGDLLDRGVLLTLPPITDQARQPERGFWRAFYAAQPGILGALLTAVSRALADVGQIERTSLPRMADFALWVEAAAPALGWMPHTFLHDYNRNRADASDLPLEASPVAHLVRALAETGWKGAPSELLKHLNAKVDEADRKQRGWPTTARALSGQLRRLAPKLRAVGVNVQFGREAGGNRPRYIVLERIAEEPSQPSPSVPGGTQTRRRGTQTAPGGTQTTLPHVQQGRLGR